MLAGRVEQPSYTATARNRSGRPWAVTAADVAVGGGGAPPAGCPGGEVGAPGGRGPPGRGDEAVRVWVAAAAPTPRRRRRVGAVRRGPATLPGWTTTLGLCLLAHSRR